MLHGGFNLRFRTFLAASMLALSVSSFGDVVTAVPPAFENTATNGTFLGPLANAARTYQFLIRADQLTAHVGRLINGITYRSLVSATTAWPTAPITFSSYDIRLSGSVLPANRSLTFALNVVGPQTLVRSGSLTIDTNAYGFGGSPAPFGPVIAFQTPYLYTDGNLATTGKG